MGFLDRLFGAAPDEPAERQAPAARRLSEDELAVERYRYLLRTAPPESVEAVHAEAFAKLTPQQRQAVFASLSEEAPAGERLVSDEPSALARAATRAELRAPGSVERAFNRADDTGGRPQQAGPSFGGMFAGSLLGSVAGVVVGSAIAQAFLPDPASLEAGADSGSEAGDSGTDGGDSGADGVTEASGADAGGDFGGFGDFGAGDFGGGGDFGF